MLRGERQRCGREVRHTHKTRDGQFLWTYASVKNILMEEAYTGVLINHRREYRNGKAQPISTGDWLRHENFYPEIIEKTTWLLVQERLKQQARPAAGNRAKHRYAGLLSCRDCGDGFIPMIRYWTLRRPSLDAHCLALQKEILKLEQEIDELVMEKLKNSECLTCQPDSI